MTDLADWLNEKYGQDYKVTQWRLPKFLVTMAGWFSSRVSRFGAKWGLEQTFDTSGTTNVLGIKFTPLKQSVQEMGDTLI
jgi:hypothetical protein